MLLAVCVLTVACAVLAFLLATRRPAGARPDAVPEFVVCAACDGPRQVRADGSCYACGSRSVLRVKERPRGGSYQHAHAEAPERDYLAGLLGKQ